MYNTFFNVFFDSDESLFYTKVGLIKANKQGIFPLHYTVWGQSKAECQDRAKLLTELLAKDIKEVK